MSPLFSLYVLSLLLLVAAPIVLVFYPNAPQWHFVSGMCTLFGVLLNIGALAFWK